MGEDWSCVMHKDRLLLWADASGPAISTTLMESINLMRKSVLVVVSLLFFVAVGVASASCPQSQVNPGVDQEPPPAGMVTIALRPGSVAVLPDKIFTMEIVIDASSQEVDAAQVYIDFDPDYLSVVDEFGQPASEIIPGTALPQTMLNTADNAAGEIGYAAGHLVPGAVLQRPFVLATIRFRTHALTSNTEVVFHLDGTRQTKVNIGYTSVPIAEITDGRVRIYVYRLFMPLDLKGNFH